MRIAVTGTHGTGKTTLVEAFVEAQPHFAHAQEAYWEMAEQGVPFASAPSIDDLAAQLEHSVGAILGAAGETEMIFDRCPLDYIAYLEVLGEGEGIDWTPTGKLLTRIEAALAALDLVAWLPISEPDAIAARIAYPGLRRAVDARLTEIVRDDALGLLARGPRVIEIGGTPAARLAHLIRASTGG